MVFGTFLGQDHSVAADCEDFAWHRTYTCACENLVFSVTYGNDDDDQASYHMLLVIV